MSLSRRDVLAASSLLLTQASWLRAAENDGDVANELEPKFAEFTSESLESIEKGMEWVMKTFNRDGGCGQDIGQPSDTACSASVGLALLSMGNTPVEGPYSRQVRGITDYLLRVANAGQIPTDRNTYIRGDLGVYADYFFVSLFLTQVIGEGTEPEPIRRCLALLIDDINKGQSPQGHWGTNALAPQIGATVGWACLRGAHFAGFRVEANIEKTREWIIEQMGAGLSGGTGGLYRNAAGIRVLYPMGREDTPEFKQAVKMVFEFVENRGTSFGRLGGEEFLSFHLINETMLQMGGDHWERWFVPARQKFMDCQNSDGSWTGYTCINSRTFCTAMALLVLSSPNRYLPVSQS